MNIPISWLKEYVDLEGDMKTFSDKMTMTGSKVETIINLGNEISKVIVGKVVSIIKHPNADKLVITKVDIGAIDTLQIVTGATNLYENAYVPVAVDNATLANGLKIKKGKLRGEVSQGMLCSIEELGYTRHDYPEAPEDGIYIFNEPQELGADVRPILELCDTVVEFEITSNRPDCQSVVGIAREAAATFNKPFKFPEIKVKEEGEGIAEEMIKVEILNSELCPRYAARVVKNIRIEPSPQWLRHRLTAAGLRPINNIVDITNYVMLELGQPMHAFDIDNIEEGKIIVRNAKDDEIFTTLDGTERKLNSSMLVIADSNKAVAIAGVMGGENSKVTGNATAVLFESANFFGPNIRVTSKKLGLRTDASGKYEKGLDPNLSITAVNRAVQLVELLGCGEVVKGVVDCYPNVRKAKKVPYCAEKINTLLGTEIKAEEMEALLNKVEIPTIQGIAQIPTFRPDIELEADIAEEVARLYGYDLIKPTLAAGTPTVGKKNYTQQIEDIIKDICVSVGLCEILNYSFESPKVFDKLLIPQEDVLRKTINIVNPLGSDFSTMKTLTLNGMLQCLSTNYNRRNEEAKLFEISKVYIPKELPMKQLPDELLKLTIGMYGKLDFYDIKGVIEEVFYHLGMYGAVEFEPCKTIPFMHGGRTAVIKVDGIDFGFIGEVHPTVLANYEIGTKAYAAVVDVKTIFEKAVLVKNYVPLPKFPSIKRDVAMTIKDEVNVRDIEKVIKENGTKLLESVQLFDVYKGQQIEEGMKSVAYNITFRSPERTLTEEEVNKITGKIILDLEEKLQAKLR